MYAETIVRHLAAMGTAFVLTVSAPTRDRALRASEAGVRAVEAAERLLSTWRDDTPLARLNAAPPASATPVTPELFALLKRVFEWEKSDRRRVRPGGGAAREGVGTAQRRPHPERGGSSLEPAPRQTARLFTFEESSLRVSRR